MITQHDMIGIFLLISFVPVIAFAMMILLQSFSIHKVKLLPRTDTVMYVLFGEIWVSLWLLAKVLSPMQFMGILVMCGMASLAVWVLLLLFWRVYGK